MHKRFESLDLDNTEQQKQYTHAACVQGVDEAQNATQATSHADMRRTTAADDDEEECRRAAVGECLIAGNGSGVASDGATASAARYGSRARLSVATAARDRDWPRPCRW